MFPNLPQLVKSRSLNSEFDHYPYPLHKACQEDNLLQAYRFLSQINQRNDDGLTPLDVCFRTENASLPLIRLLIFHDKFQVKQTAENVLRWVCHLQLGDCVKHLLQQGMDPNPNLIDEKIPPVFIAVKNFDLDTVESLLVAKADVNVEYKCETCASLLLRYDDLQTKLPIWKLFVENNLDVNMKITEGCTFLHLVRDEPIIRVLLEAGANPNIYNSNFQSVYDVHGHYNSGKVIRMWENNHQHQMIVTKNILKTVHLNEDIINFILSFFGIIDYRRSSAEIQNTWMGDSEDDSKLLHNCSTSFVFPSIEEPAIENELDEFDLLDKYYESDSCFSDKRPQLRSATPRTRRRRHLIRSQSEKTAKKHVKMKKKCTPIRSTSSPGFSFPSNESNSFGDEPFGTNSLFSYDTLTDDESDIETSLVGCSVEEIRSRAEAEKIKPLPLKLKFNNNL